MTRLLHEAAFRLTKLNKFLNTRYRSLLLRCAVIFLAIGIGYSFLQYPSLLTDISWNPVLVVILILVPSTAWLNAIEFQETGRLAGVSIDIRQSLEINIIGSAANMLPLPGGAVVRIAGLNTAGVRASEATSATLLVALIWIGVGFLLSGVGVYLSGSEVVGATFLVIGVLAWFSACMFGSSMKGGWMAVLRLTLVKIALVSVDILRIYFCFSAFSISVSIFQSAGLSFAAIVGSAVSIVPAGLGVREMASVILAPAIGVLASQAFVVATLNRLLGLIVTLPLAFIFVEYQSSKRIKRIDSAR